MKITKKQVKEIKEDILVKKYILLTQLEKSFEMSLKHAQLLSDNIYLLKKDIKELEKEHKPYDLGENHKVK